MDQARAEARAAEAAAEQRIAAALALKRSEFDKQARSLLHVRQQGRLLHCQSLLQIVAQCATVRVKPLYTTCA